MKFKYELTKTGIIKIDFMTNFLAWCVGAPVDDLIQCPQNEIIKIKALGAVLIIPPLISLFSGFYFFYVTINNIYFALLLAPIWSMIILIIDRFLIVSLKPVHNASQHFKSPFIYLRIVLSILIAYFISIPVELGFFRNSINEQLFNNRTQQIQIVENNFSSKIDSLNNFISKKEEEVSKLRSQYLGELDGTKGTGLRGNGEIAHLKRNEYDKAYKGYLVNKQNILMNISLLAAKEGTLINSIKSNQSKDIVARNKAFDELRKKDFGVLLYSTVIFLTLILLDLIPLIGKLLQKPGSLQDRFFTQSLRESLKYKRKREILQDTYYPVKDLIESYHNSRLESTYTIMNAELAREEAIKIFSDNKKFEDLVKNRFKIVNRLDDNASQETAKSLIEDSINNYYSKFNSH